MSLRGRKNVTVDLSIFSWAGASAILDDTFSASENRRLECRRQRAPRLNPLADPKAGGVVRDLRPVYFLLTVRILRRWGHQHRYAAHLPRVGGIESRATARVRRRGLPKC